MAIENANFGAIQTTPIGNAYRGFGADIFNQRAIAKEEWQRAEQASDNQLVRDLYYQSVANEFNALEAQKDRDWQERMSSTSYQRVVDDLKKAGLNPILAYENGGASTPSGSTANSASSRTNSTNQTHGGVANTASFLQALGLTLLGAGKMMPVKTNKIGF